MLSSLPTDLANIIMNYTSQLEHVEKFQGSLNIINNIDYVYYENDDGLKMSRREIPHFLSNETVEYYHQLSYKNNVERYHFLNIEHHFETYHFLNKAKVLYPTINLSRIHYGSKYRLEDSGIVYI